MWARIPSIRTHESCTVRRGPPQLDAGMSTCETKVLRVVFGPAPLLITLLAEYDGRE